MVINGVSWGYNPLNTPLLTSWDIQVRLPWKHIVPGTIYRARGPKESGQISWRHHMTGHGPQKGGSLRISIKSSERWNSRIRSHPIGMRMGFLSYLNFSISKGQCAAWYLRGHTGGGEQPLSWRVVMRMINILFEYHVIQCNIVQYNRK